MWKVIGTQGTVCSFHQTTFGMNLWVQGALVETLHLLAHSQMVVFRSMALNVLDLSPRKRTALWWRIAILVAEARSSAGENAC